MNTVRKAFLLILCIFSLLACSNEPEPIVVAKQFWKAMEQGDIENAKQFVTPDSEKSVTWQADRQVSDVVVGVLSYEDEQALVATSLLTGSDDDASSLQFDTVLVQHKGEWRVDFNKTVGAMISVSLDEFGTALKESVEEMGSAFGDAVSDAMEEAAQGVSEALQRAAEEMRKAAEELRKEREQREQQEREESDEGQAELSDQSREA